MSDEMPVDGGGRLAPVLQGAFSLGASDVHLKSGVAPLFRVDGDLRPVQFPPLTADELLQLSVNLSGKSAADLASVYQLEFSYHWPGIGRLRGHFYRHLGEPALALRPIPLKVPSMNELRLPAAVKRISDLTQGLVVVTGATGMGKSTTLACMLDTVARNSCRHIITVEDPVEYMISDGLSCVNQREVGRDVADFGSGLRAALRQDPDVLMIGEARDRESFEVALHAACSGHLVLTSAHFADATATVSGIVALGDPREQINWRFRLAEGLRAIISQRLLPRRGGPGRVLATEVLVNDGTIRACIQDETRTKGIRAALERGKGEGQTHTMDQCLIDLLQARLITVEAAQSAAANPGDLMREVTLRRIAT